MLLLVCTLMLLLFTPASTLMLLLVCALMLLLVCLGSTLMLLLVCWGRRHHGHRHR